MKFCGIRVFFATNPENNETENEQGMKMLLVSGVNVFIEVGFDMEVACCV